MSELVSIELLLEGIQFGGGSEIIGTLANQLGVRGEGGVSIGDDLVKAVIDEMFSQLDLNSFGDRAIVNMCLIVLANLTFHEPNSQIFVDYTVDAETFEPNEVLKMCIEEFLKHNAQNEPSTTVVDYRENSKDLIAEDPWGYMSSVLCNISRIENGRKIFMKQSTGYTPKLLSQIRSKNAVRRRGAVACIRTCLFDTEVHFWLLVEVKALSTLLVPLVVATPFTEEEKVGMDPTLWMMAEDDKKVHEPHGDILLMLVECVVLLCQKRQNRDELRKLRVYPICRNLDYLQEDERVSEIILDIVNLLMRDEEQTEEERKEAEAQREKEMRQRQEKVKFKGVKGVARVLDYWFGEGYTSSKTALVSATDIESKMGKWFGGTDREFNMYQLSEEAAALIGRVSTGFYNEDDDWNDTPRGMLARVLVLDQFPRCAFRGTRKAFVHDAAALKIVETVMAKGAAWIEYYFKPVEIFFLGVAAQHSESRSAQKLGLQLSEMVFTTSPDDVKAYFKGIPGYPQEHADVIESFGRFPGRNAALRRDSTKEEIVWMESDACPVWAKSQMPAEEVESDEDEATTVTGVSAATDVTGDGTHLAISKEVKEEAAKTEINAVDSQVDENEDALGMD